MSNKASALNNNVDYFNVPREQPLLAWGELPLMALAATNAINLFERHTLDFLLSDPDPMLLDGFLHFLSLLSIFYFDFKIIYSEFCRVR